MSCVLQLKLVNIILETHSNCILKNNYLTPKYNVYIFKNRTVKYPEIPILGLKVCMKKSLALTLQMNREDYSSGREAVEMNPS